jgi:hypothetical protein
VLLEDIQTFAVPLIEYVEQVIVLERQAIELIEVAL